MTLDETIKRTEELAELNEDQARVYKEQGFTIGYWSYEEDAKKHRQLAEWLKELKTLREGLKDVVIIPKGHGRLKDADYIIKQLLSLPKNEFSTEDMWAIKVLELAPTIVEADKEE